MLEFIRDFKNNYKMDPIHQQSDKWIIVKLYETDSSVKTYETRTVESKKTIRERTVNPRFIVLPLDFNETKIKIKDLINKSNLYISPALANYIKLQDIRDEYLLVDGSLKPDYINQKPFNISMYANYLKHRSFRNNINLKLNKIIKHKFSLAQTGKPNTSAILSNVGYIIKDKEDSYLELSRNDYSFIQSFMNKMIRSGGYKLKITESLPLYKEDISKIIEIGRKILKLSNNIKSIKKLSKDELESQRNSLEGVWQLYFEKYLRLFFMKYRAFYSKTVFKPMVGYEKSSIPDFLAVDMYNNIDIIEIKRHDTPLFRKEKGRDSIYPSHDLNKSVFQLNKYLDLTADLIDIEKINDAYTKSLITNNKLYRPRGILIISSMKHIGSKALTVNESIRFEKEIKKLKTTYSNIEIVLFDELIDSLELYLNEIELSIASN